MSDSSKLSNKVFKEAFFPQDLDNSINMKQAMIPVAIGNIKALTLKTETYFHYEVILWHFSLQNEWRNIINCG